MTAAELLQTVLDIMYTAFCVSCNTTTINFCRKCCAPETKERKVWSRLYMHSRSQCCELLCLCCYTVEFETNIWQRIKSVNLHNIFSCLPFDPTGLSNIQPAGLMRWNTFWYSSNLFLKKMIADLIVKDWKNFDSQTCLPIALLY